MRKIFLSGALLIGLVACGRGDDELARDSVLAQTDSTYAINDRPAPTPAPSPAATPPAPPPVSRPAPPPAPAPRPAPAPQPPAPTVVTLASGSVMSGTLDRTISSKTNKVGDQVTVRVTDDVRNGSGAIVVPAGSTVNLTIAAIEPSRDKAQTGKLTLAVSSITIRGETRSIEADVTSVTSKLKSGGVGTSEAAKVGAGAVIGGIAGRVIGGNKTGTIIGAVVGAAAGAAVATETANRDVVVEAGSTIGITLREPLRVTSD